MRTQCDDCQERISCVACYKARKAIFSPWNQHLDDWLESHDRFQVSEPEGAARPRDRKERDR